jgi:KDO2-lipid IV(A) lauroyltransferase
MIAEKIAYFLFRGIVAFFRIIPFRILYIISDGVYFLLYKIVGYRKSVVRKNLEYCFPEKSIPEKRAIERKFYKNLTDLILESLKGYTVSEKEILKRFSVTNPEILDEYYNQGRSLIMALAHMGNWELATGSVVKDFKHKPVVLYKPLSNKYIDSYVYTQRKSFGLELLAIFNTAAYFSKKREQPKAFFMVADQYSPSTKRKNAVFFGKETVFLHGPETYSRKYNLPIIYMEIKKIKRGHYLATLSILEDEPTKLKEGELTQKYALKLEESIKKYPDTWMWSHKRWKDKDLY